jgi:hypothetical protein
VAVMGRYTPLRSAVMGTALLILLW